MRERIHKVLAARGVVSRRRAEELVAAGEVTVNGRPAKIGETVDSDADVIAVRGAPVPPVTHRYLMLNKPAGVVTTGRPRASQQTVADLIRIPQRVVPVGRLDKETRGLLLLTNDGEWANVVTHPRYRVEKEYIVEVAGRVSDKVVAELERGVPLPGGGTSAPARVRLLRVGKDRSTLSITVHEGKKRQIRHMTATVGYPTLGLRRTRVDGIYLGELREGSWRDLTEPEVRSIFGYTG